MALTVVKYRKSATGETTATPAILVKSKRPAAANPVIKQEVTEEIAKVIFYVIFFGGGSGGFLDYFFICCAVFLIYYIFHHTFLFEDGEFNISVVDFAIFSINEI